MLRLIFFLTACACAAVAPPLRPSREASLPRDVRFPGWPERFEGQPLQRLPAEEQELAFFASIGGEIGRFRAGGSELVLRWIPDPTRHLHPAQRCLSASGYEVTPVDLWSDEAGCLWAHFEAVRGSERLGVRECIVDAAGNSFGDLSTWFWRASTGASPGPWWVYTVVQRKPAS